MNKGFLTPNGQTSMQFPSLHICNITECMYGKRTRLCQFLPLFAFFKVKKQNENPKQSWRPLYIKTVWHWLSGKSLDGTLREHKVDQYMYTEWKKSSLCSQWLEMVCCFTTNPGMRRRLLLVRRLPVLHGLLCSSSVLWKQLGKGSSLAGSQSKRKMGEEAEQAGGKFHAIIIHKMVQTDDLPVSELLFRNSIRMMHKRLQRNPAFSNKEGSFHFLLFWISHTYKTRPSSSFVVCITVSL